MNDIVFNRAFWSLTYAASINYEDLFLFYHQLKLNMGTLKQWMLVLNKIWEIILGITVF